MLHYVDDESLLNSIFLRKNNRVIFKLMLPYMVQLIRKLSFGIKIVFLILLCSTSQYLLFTSFCAYKIFFCYEATEVQRKKPQRKNSSRGMRRDLRTLYNLWMLLCRRLLLINAVAWCPYADANDRCCCICSSGEPPGVACVTQKILYIESIQTFMSS